MAALAKIFNFHGAPDQVPDFATPPGHYIKFKPPKETSSMVWGKRINEYGKLTDDIAFYGTDKGKNKCMISAKSRS